MEDDGEGESDEGNLEDDLDGGMAIELPGGGVMQIMEGGPSDSDDDLGSASDDDAPGGGWRAVVHTLCLLCTLPCFAQ